MRTRSKGAPSPTLSRGDTWIWQDKTGPVTQTYTSYSYPGDCDVTVMTDEPHPGFFKALKRGELIISPMTRVRTIRSVPDGHSERYVTLPANRIQWSRTGSANWTQVKLTEQGNPVYSVPTLACKSADTLLLEAVAQVDPTDFNLMEDVIQVRQFIEAVAKPVWELREIVREARRFHPEWPKVKPKAVLGGAASAWLRYRNEFLPTYNSITDLIAGMNGPWKRLRKGVRLRSSRRDSDAFAVSGTYWNGNAHCQYGVFHSQNIDRRAVIYYRLQADRGGILQTYGWRVKDIPVGLWNVIKLSYMIDRVVNISHYIQACANAFDGNITFEGGCVVERSRKEVAYRLVQEQWDSLYTVSTPEVRTVTDSVVRTVAPSVASIIDPRKLAVSPKGLVNSSSKVLDVLALVIQMMKF